MSSPWPRNIVPYDERKLRALSNVEAVALYSLATDQPVVEAALPKAEQALAAELVAVGLLERVDGRLAPTNRHRRDPDDDMPGRIEHKRAVVGYARALVDGTARALQDSGSGHAAIGVVTLPDTPEVVAQATAIIAEAEDQLRALAEETPPGERNVVRVVVFLGSAP